MNSCYKCKYFNGEQGDGEQFCDRKEDYVSEHCWCPDFVGKDSEDAEQEDGI